jgi:hypothetical protein
MKAEKIFRDPVRYLKDPSRYNSESAVELKKSEDLKTEKTRAERKSRAGFNKRLLKSDSGEEQCFEEARANAGSYKKIIGTSMNFNQLHNSIDMNENRNMNLIIEETCMDMSMSESVSGSIEFSTGREEIIGKKTFESQTVGKTLFHHMDGSFDERVNQTAISHASSTINDIDIACVGAPGKQEETINTKFAMKELSMMFSSPALGVNSARKRIDHSSASRIDESVAYVGKADTSFGNVGDGVLLDNSICNFASAKPDDERKPFAKCTSNGGNEGCKGFTIFQDDASDGGNEHRDNTRSSPGFQVYDEGKNDSSLQITKESPEKIVQSMVPFQIYDEENADSSQESAESKFEIGDTANIADAIALLDEKLGVDDTNSSSSDEESQHIASEGDATTTLSLFNHIFENEPDMQTDERPLRGEEADMFATNGNKNRRKPVR